MYRSLPEYKELLQFKKLKKQKLQQMQAESGFVQHVGFKVSNLDLSFKRVTRVPGVFNSEIDKHSFRARVVSFSVIL